MITFQRVLIVGVGMVGGSWALALRRAGFDGDVIGFDPDPGAVEALAAGALDMLVRRPLAPGDLRARNLVVLATPVGTAVELAPTIGPAIPAGAVVTDVGSAKRVVCAAWQHHAGTPGGGHFVGGHPMAGSHRRGFGAARADLFDDAVYYLAEGGGAADDRAARSRVAGTVEALGARTVLVDPADHDRDVATTSHLPQLVSWALDAVVRRAAPELPGAAGLADMTRLAASDRDLWQDVLDANHDHVCDALDAMIAELTRARGALASAR